MSIKHDELYPKYLIWLEDRKMSSGIKELSKISLTLFEKFKLRYTLNPSLKEKIDNSYKSIDREEKIDNIVDDDFENFLKDLGDPPHYHEDIF
jgi:hypothetical protein